MHLNLSDFKSAHERISPHIIHTPLLEIHETGLSHRLFLKLENQQKTNSFKVRGAFNALLSLSPETRAKGVVTRSSGNFASALAYAGQKMHVPTVIVLPTTAPKTKVALTKQYNPEMIFAGTTHAEGNAEVAKLSSERHLVKLSPYDHIDVIKGQGTIALEIIHDLPSIRHFFCPIGGGGLMGGNACVLKQINSQIEVIGVEPEGANDYFRSRKETHPVSIAHPNTIADGLRANEVGKLNRPLLDHYVDTVVTVSDDEIIQAMKFLRNHCGMIVEPSGAAALASLLHAPHHLKGDTVCIISGANVDPDSYQRWIL